MSLADERTGDAVGACQQICADGIPRLNIRMPDQPDALVLALLRKLDEKLDRVSDDLREIKTRVGILEQQYASMSNRIDRIESRLERIERRLELAEA